MYNLTRSHGAEATTMEKRRSCSVTTARVWLAFTAPSDSGSDDSSAVISTVCSHSERDNVQEFYTANFFSMRF